MADIKIDGLAELQLLLNQLPATIEGRIVRGALRAGAKVVAIEAKRRCPVGTDVPKGETPGSLRDSIHVSMRSKNGHVTATIKAGGEKAHYAHMVEFGTARHWIKPRSRKSLFIAGLFKEAVEHPGAKKHPFMRPAIDSKATEALQAVADYIKARIDKETAKI